LKVDLQCFRWGRCFQAGPEAEVPSRMNADYSGLGLVGDARCTEPDEQAMRCRGNLGPDEYFAQAVGALAASGRPAGGYRRRRSSTASPKLVQYRVRLAPRRTRESRSITRVGVSLVVGWTDPEGRLVNAGRAGVSISEAELARLWSRLQPLAIRETPLDVLPPRTSRFGLPLVLSRVHWVRPELVVEVKYLTWTADNLLRQVVYEGLREDKPVKDVRREVPQARSARRSNSAGSSA
jgi:hypothetical protein